METGRVCGIENCRSRHFHLEDDGFVYCRRGHRQEGGLVEDAEGFASQAARRTRKQAEEVEKGSALLSGREAVELYLQCYQLVLWKQVHWLVNAKGYPVQLESVIRDLWALRVQVIENSIEEPEIESASQLFGSRSDTEDSDGERIGPQSLKARYTQTVPRLIESLALCYLGMLMLRLPICFGDIYEWVESEQLLYMTAMERIPRAMRVRIPARWRRMLQPRAGIANLERFHMATFGLAATFHEKFGLTIPELNFPLYLFRFVTDLSLPLDVIPAVRILKILLKRDFTFPTSFSRFPISDHPEVQLICLLVIAVKLFYPFDTVERHPRTLAEPAASTVDWDYWNSIQRKANTETAQDEMENATALNITEHDVLGMTGKEMDNYLDWFQRTWITEDIPEEDRNEQFRENLLQLFPLEELPDGSSTVGAVNDQVLTSAKLQQVDAVQASVKAIRAVDDSVENDSKDEVLRPGEQYRRYRSADELPKTARGFFEATAKLAALSLDTLVLAVFHTEAKLHRWVTKERKRLRRKAKPSTSNEGGS